MNGDLKEPHCFKNHFWNLTSQILPTYLRIQCHSLNKRWLKISYSKLDWPISLKLFRRRWM